MKTSESIKNISPALLEAQKSMGNALKDAKNPFYKSKYADLNSIREATIPVLNEAGITVLQPTGMVDGSQFVITTLLHLSGEYISSMTQIVCAKQNDPQAYGSAVSYARRYGLQSLVCIGAEDDDAEANMNRDVKTTQTQKTTTPVQTSTVVAAAPKAKGFTAFKKTEAVADNSKSNKGDMY